MIRVRVVALAAAMLAAAAPTLVRAQQLTADLTEHHVDVTTGFTGTSVTVFGTIEGGGDIVVVARGPEGEMVVRRKSRQAALWLNTSSLQFKTVPSYYAVLSNRPYTELANQTTRDVEQIGSDTLNLMPGTHASAAEAADFRIALLDDLQKAGLYTEQSHAITWLSDHLFRATLDFPASIPRGTYPVDVFLIRHGQIVATETIPLIVAESGLEAITHSFATHYSAAYGLIAAALAAMAGWFGSVLFRSAP